MSMQNKILKVVLISFVVFLGAFIVISRQNNKIKTPDVHKIQQNPQQQPNVIKPYNISNKIPNYLTYDGVVNQINNWNKEAPEITEVGTYGKTSNNKDIYYIRVCGNKNANLPKVLITACIHGNEKIANATVMGMIGKLLSDYGRDEKVTKLVSSRDIYWIPVVSPDSYISDSRHVDGVDPNRNFPYPGNPNVNSVPPISALREFFLKHKFLAVVSTHSYSRIYLYPYGYTATPCPDVNTYKDICGRMANLANYSSSNIRSIRTAQPYHGFEADWFYENGAFAIVSEVSLDFKPAESTIAPEVERNYKAYLLFIEEAPVVNLTKRK